MAKISLLEGLDVFDQTGDAPVGELPLERGHRGWKAFDDLGLRLQDRLAQVVLVDTERTEPRDLLLLAEQALERRPHLLAAVDRVARRATALVEGEHAQVD